MIEDINTNWYTLIKNYDNNQIIKFDEFINKEKEKFKDHLEIYPISNNIFKCFKYFNIEDTKLIILGQDPYHGFNQATGLCFDINKNCKYPPSLKNIEKKLGFMPDFDYLANNGVLLLNSSLSVIQGKPGSHLKYWLPFTKFIINETIKYNNNVKFIIWGAFALNLIKDLNIKEHNLHISSHPSPLSFNKPLKNYLSFKDAELLAFIKKINILK